MMRTATKQLHQTVGKLETRPVARSAFSLADMAVRQIESQ